MIPLRLEPSSGSPLRHSSEWLTDARSNLAAFIHLIASLLLLPWMTGCSAEQTEALGTLQWDQVHGRAIASEAIIEVLAREGETVKQDQPLVRLDSSLQEAKIARFEAEVQQASWHLKQLEAGYRPEEIASAEAESEGAEINLQTRQIEYDRDRDLFKRDATSARKVELSGNALAQAKSQQRSASERSNMISSGYRTEEIEQSKAALAAAEAELHHAKEQLDRYTVTAERDGVLDSLPFKLGDKPPAGAVVTTVLAGDRPWGRIYLPQPWLSRVRVGDEVAIAVDGRATPFRGRVRHISSNASFTPYYTLSEEDRSRLSFVTEVDLIDPEANQLPLGIPVRMQLRGQSDQP